MSEAYFTADRIRQTIGREWISAPQLAKQLGVAVSTVTRALNGIKEIEHNRKLTNGRKWRAKKLKGNALARA